MNVGQDVIRPTTERLTGHRVIASYFDSNPDKEPLGRATLRLIQTEPSASARSYSAVGSEWIINSTPPPRPEAEHDERARAAAPTLETQLGALKAQVVLLTAVQEGLLVRLARLEAKFGADGERSGGDRRTGERRRSGGASFEAAEQFEDSSRAGRRERAPEERQDADAEPREEGRAQPQRAAARGEPVGAEPATSEPDEENLSEDEPASEAEPGSDSTDAIADEPEEALPTPDLVLPPVVDLARCMALLIGGDVSAVEAEPFAITRATKDCYCSAILNDADEVVGMILMDLRATVFLGGTLMMLPRGELEQQLKRVSPGEDSVAASAEVCNALSGSMNDAQNTHIRTGALEKFEHRAWDWIANPAERRDLQDSFGGRTVVFSRRLLPPKA